MLCRKLHYQKGFNLNPFSYKIRPEAGPSKPRRAHHSDYEAGLSSGRLIEYLDVRKKMSAVERGWNNLKGFKDLYLKAKARIWQ